MLQGLKIKDGVKMYSAGSESFAVRSMVAQNTPSVGETTQSIVFISYNKQKSGLFYSNAWHSFDLNSYLHILKWGYPLPHLLLSGSSLNLGCTKAVPPVGLPAQSKGRRDTAVTMSRLHLRSPGPLQGKSCATLGWHPKQARLMLGKAQ